MISGSKESGQTLVGALLASALLGAFVVVSTKFSAISLEAQKFLDTESELEDLRNFIRNGIDCERTARAIAENPPDDSGESFVAILGENGPVINEPIKHAEGEFSYHSEDGVYGARYELRASVDEAEGTLKFDIEYLYKPVKLSPLRKDETSWKKLFKDVPIVCAKPSVRKCSYERVVVGGSQYPINNGHTHTVKRTISLPEDAEDIEATIYEVHMDDRYPSISINETVIYNSGHSGMAQAVAINPPSPVGHLLAPGDNSFQGTVTNHKFVIAGNNGWAILGVFSISYLASDCSLNIK